MKSGQILIIVLLIVVVTLAVGLSIASRNLTNLRTATQTERSQRAFSAAEGGVEDVLSRLSTIATTYPVEVADSGGRTETVTVGDLQASVNVKGKNVFEWTLDTDEVGQVDLTGFGGTVTVEWVKKNNALENPTPQNLASLELTFICENSNTTFCTDVTPGSSYTQRRFYYSSQSRTEEVGSITSVACSGIDLFCSRTLPEGAGNFSGTNVKYLRIRPFWNNATVRVSGSGTGLPVQIYEVSSLASTPEGISRKVQVTRTALPTLPAAFDYALFSEGPIQK